jgi:energy-converting hydrogenase A subunit M
VLVRKRRCSPLPGLHSFRTQTDVRCLEKLGYKVAIVKDRDWIKLASHEKIPFLMRTVKESAKEQFQDPDM